ALLRPLRAAPAPTGGGRSGVDRRAFLKAALAVSAVAAAGEVVTRTFGVNDAAASRAAVRLPGAAVPAGTVPQGAELGVAGLTPYLTTNRDFYRVDTALEVPAVPIEGWSLRIHGLVDREIELTYTDLLKRRLVEERVTLTCVSNPVGGGYLGNAAWLGVPMHELLAEAGPRPGADAVRSTSVDGFTVGTPLPVLMDRGRGALLAIGMNGQPLPLEHGFPARMVTPGLYGYVSATKWVVDLEVTRFSDFTAYWTSRGYAAQAPIKTSSRIDVPTSFAQVPAGRTPVAGVAWSQDRGIAKVEVRVDGGPWQRARLAAEDTVNAWRQWVWDWDARPGSHTIEVRATDKSGYTQTSRTAPIAPDGSTGLDSVNVTVS
ncbi:MAG: molybdopterin-dependent oxidoreductase, partial [Nocardioidaceae bacterium]